jgi:hypothetical protein
VAVPHTAARPSVQVIVLIKLGVNMETTWRLQEESIHADPVQGRIAIMFDYAHAREEYEESFWSRWNYWKRKYVSDISLSSRTARTHTHTHIRTHTHTRARARAHTHARTTDVTTKHDRR